MKKPFHLAWFLSQGYGPKSWRGDWPGSDIERWMMPDLFVDLAQGMERACFDYMIIEDSSNVPYTYKGSHDTYLQYAASAPKLDPAVLVPYLAQATKHLGLVPTLSVSEYPPYLLARLVNSLDHVTEGRIGWNCVTGSNDGAAQNYGHDKHRPHDERYDVADEFADVVTRLWEAWEPDAVVLDRAKPMFADGSQGPSHQPRGQVFPLPRALERAALAAGPRADLPGRRLAARPAIRLALGRHHHHRGRRQHRQHEGLSRPRAPAGRRVRAQSRRHQGAVPRPSDHRRQHGGARASASAWSRSRPRSISTCTCRACRA